MSGRRSCSTNNKAEAGLTIAVLLAAGALLYVTIRVLAGVFSLHGLAYAFGIAPAGTLPFAPLVRVTTFVLLIELGATVSLLLDFVDGRRYMTFRLGWLIAHVTLARRIVFAMGWLVVSAVTLMSDMAAHRRFHLVRRDVGVLDLWYRLAQRLSELRSACLALFSPAARHADAVGGGASPVTGGSDLILTGVIVGAREDEAA